MRESDGKGLHTTTVRQMHRLARVRKEAAGSWIRPECASFKCPKLTSGVAEVFDDIMAMTLECRFTNCTHTEEPGCAIRAAIAQKTLEPARFNVGAS